MPVGCRRKPEDPREPTELGGEYANTQKSVFQTPRGSKSRTSFLLCDNANHCTTIVIYLTIALRQTLLYLIMRWHLEWGGVWETTFYIQPFIFYKAGVFYVKSCLSLSRADCSGRIRAIIEKPARKKVKIWENLKKKKKKGGKESEHAKVCVPPHLSGVCYETEFHIWWEGRQLSRKPQHKWCKI